MGQAAAPLLRPDDELCTCLRHLGKRWGGEGPPKPVPPAAEAADQEADGPEPGPLRPSPVESSPGTPRSAGSEDPVSPGARSGRSASTFNQSMPLSPKTLQLGAAMMDPAGPVAHLPPLTPRTVLGECGAFSSYARPQEVEYWDAEGDWTRLARNPDGTIDLLVNGSVKLHNLASVRVEGFRLYVEGSSGDDGSMLGHTSLLTREEATAGGRGYEMDILRRLDRNDDAEDLEDWSHCHAIIQRVTALFAQPEALALSAARPPTQAVDLSEQRLAREPGGADDGKADLTPEGFRVLCTGHKAVYRDHSNLGRSVSVVSLGLYFFVDARSCPRLAFSEEPLEVEQWRGGRLHWSGKVSIWQGDAGLHDGPKGCTAYGCRWPPTKAAAEGQWEPGDVVFVIGYHSDAKTFGGGGYRRNLAAYETGIGCNPEDVDVDAAPQLRDALRDSASPRQLHHSSTLASTASRSSSFASLDRLDRDHQAEALGTATAATSSSTLSGLGHLMSASSQVRSVPLSSLHEDRG